MNFIKNNMEYIQIIKDRKIVIDCCDGIKLSEIFGFSTLLSNKNGRIYPPEVIKNAIDRYIINHQM